MTTKLWLRNTNNTGISDGATVYRDLLTTQGSADDEAVVDTQASGTEIQWTLDTTGDVEIQWLSGYTPLAGFTLTAIDFVIRASESNGAANCGMRARVFKRAANGTETEIGGGPFDDGVELGGGSNLSWTANVTDTAFAVNDRLLIKFYITNIGTMGGGHNATMEYDSSNDRGHVTLAETVVFSSTPVPTGRSFAAIMG